MKKKKAKSKSNKEVKQMLVKARVVPELVIWCFNEDEDIIRHYADQLANAIHLSYNLSNFGVQSFGLSEE